MTADADRDSPSSTAMTSPTATPTPRCPARCAGRPTRSATSSPSRSPGSPHSDSGQGAGHHEKIEERSLRMCPGRQRAPYSWRLSSSSASSRASLVCSIAWARTSLMRRNDSSCVPGAPRSCFRARIEPRPSASRDPLRAESGPPSSTNTSWRGQMQSGELERAGSRRKKSQCRHVRVSGSHCQGRTVKAGGEE